MLPAVTTRRPRFVVCEDGAEYIDRFRRFLGATFEFVAANDLAAATAGVASAQGLLLDLDFRRTPPERLVDEHGATPAAPDEGTRRRLVESQGILILRALRARGVALPVLLFADVADATQVAFLERTLAPLVVAPSSMGLGEIAAWLGRPSGGPPAGAAP